MSAEHSTELPDGSTNDFSPSRMRKRSCAVVEGNGDDSVKRARVEESLIETQVAATHRDEGTSPGQCSEPSATVEEDRSVKRGHVLERQESCSTAVDEHASNGQSELTSSASDAEDSMYGSGGTPKAYHEDMGGNDSWNEDESGALEEGKEENDKPTRVCADAPSPHVPIDPHRNVFVKRKM